MASVNRGKVLRSMPEDEYRALLQRQIERNSRPSESGCLEWVATKFSNGYGSTRLYGQVTSAHRAAFYAKHGALTPGKDVCHSCDNRACVNPAHLYEASHLENMRDMIRKGRRRQGAPNPRRGLQNNQSKPVFVAGFVFGSMGEAARVLSVTKRAISYRVKAGTAAFI